MIRICGYHHIFNYEVTILHNGRKVERWQVHKWQIRTIHLMAQFLQLFSIWDVHKVIKTANIHLAFNKTTMIGGDLATIGYVMKEELGFALDMIRKAPAFTKSLQQRKLYVYFVKFDRSTVTIADYGSQLIVAYSLQHAFPEDRLVAEEDILQFGRGKNLFCRLTVSERFHLLGFGSRTFTAKGSLANNFLCWVRFIQDYAT